MVAWVRPQRPPNAPITGIDLERHQLSIDVPDLDGALPIEEPEDDDLELDQDEHLPWPDAQKLSVVWQKYGGSYHAGHRYYMGKSPEEETLMQHLASGYQRQRHGAALAWALLDAEQPLVNTRRKVEEAKA